MTVFTLTKIGAANYTEEPSMTVVGIQRDGTVLAGDYAEDIQSEGQLAGLSMSGGMIVGLANDGSLKMIGQYVEFMADVVESWTNIAAVKVGSTSKIQAIVNAPAPMGSSVIWNTIPAGRNPLLACSIRRLERQRTAPGGTGTPRTAPCPPPTMQEDGSRI